MHLCTDTAISCFHKMDTFRLFFMPWKNPSVESACGSFSLPCKCSHSAKIGIPAQAPLSDTPRCSGFLVYKVVPKQSTREIFPRHLLLKQPAYKIKEDIFHFNFPSWKYRHLNRSIRANTNSIRMFLWLHWYVHCGCHTS